VVEQASEDITFAWGNEQLAGTLHLPTSPAPHPAVLMLQGSGPDDRYSGVYFLPIREAFLSRGIATFSFDKPGIGGSSGDWHRHALGDRADQALAAIAVLHEHPLLDPQRVGVWGHSQGGWLVQMLAARLPELAFVIANSGPGIGVEQQDLYGCEHSMRAAGRSEDDIERALAFMNAVHAAALRGDDYATVDRQLLTPARGEPWSSYLPLDDEGMWELARAFMTERYEPEEALARIRCPILAIFGARDALVPAWESAEIYSRALRAADNRDATIIVFPQGDHRIGVKETGAFAEGYLDLLADWAARRVAAR
jgi:hypothetical protein